MSYNESKKLNNSPPMMTVPKLIFVFALLFCGSAFTAPLLTYPIDIKGKKIRVEVANTEKLRKLGLMHRKKLSDDAGMIFVYDKARVAAMWMKNTLIPLSVAFVNNDGVIINIEKMEPLDLTPHKSHSPAKYALEMRRGWFFENGIKPGDKLRGIKKIPSAR